MQTHQVETSILRSLRRTQSARFSELMHPTGLESDSFKFYTRKLLKLGYIAKQPDRSYSLTAKGKEFANNLDELNHSIQKQPKLSICLVVSRQNADGQTEYLFQKRLRQPFMHYWGFLSGPVQWGENAEETARHELHKQTGLQAEFTTYSFYRERDFGRTDGQLLEDKLFLVLTADKVSGFQNHDWSGGISAWMTADEILRMPKHFKTTASVLQSLQSNPSYFRLDCEYENDY